MSTVTLELKVRSDGRQASAEIDRVDKSVKKADASTKQLDKSLSELGKSLTRTGRNFTIGLTAPIAAAGVGMAKLAIDAVETANKFDVVFRGSLVRVNAELERLRDTVPLTRTEMRELSSGVQDLLVPLGLARGAAADLSVEALSLAADLGSFNNAGTEEVLEAIKSALAGSSEPMRRFGVDTRETRLQTLALNEGLIQQGEELDGAARAQAVFAAITADSSDALGDAARTAGDNAAQIRFIRRDILEAAEAIGNDLLPVASDLINAVRGITQGLAEMDEETRRNVIFTGAALAAIGPLLIGVGSLIRAVVALKGAMTALNLVMKANPIVRIATIAATAGAALATMKQDGVEPLTVGLRAMGDAAEKAAQQITGAFNAVEVGEVDAAISAITDEIDALQAVLERSTLDKFILGGFGKEDEIRAQIEALIEDRRVLLDRAEALEANEEAEQATKQAVEGTTTAVEDNTGATEENTAAKEAAIAAGESVIDSLLRQIEQNNELIIQQEAGAEAARDYAEAQLLASAANDEQRETISNLLEVLEAQEGLLDDSCDALDDVTDCASGLQQQLDKVEGPKIGVDTRGLDAAVQLSATLSQSLKDLGASEGEFQSITAALNAVALAQGIVAILNQGQGDPFSAFGRIAAMIGIVTPLLANLGVSINAIGGIGDGGADGFQQQQASQGTGTVLGDADEDSSSILNALEITADATSELVGINRGMLRALEGLENAIGSASIDLARGALDIDFGEITGFKSFIQQVDEAIISVATLGGLLDPLGIFDGLFKLLGGKSKVIDSGIQILAGSINDAIDGVLFEAFQDVKIKKFFFSSGKLKTQTEALSDEFNSTLGLIFESIIDSVLQAGLALGIDQADLQSRIDAFQIEAQQISLKDLSAEEQQEELQAVFGAIFDDLAGFVVPFADQFQQLGEGLAETLVRVATSVQVAEVAIDRLGLIAERLGAEQFAQLSVGLVEAAGGLENFISGFTGFFDAFATDAQKLEAAQSDINAAFEELGVAVPMTAEELFKLIGTFDATTAEGQQAIATLLELTPAFQTFFDLLADEQQRLDSLQAGIDDLLGIQETEIESVNRRAAALKEQAVGLNEIIAVEEARAVALADIERRRAEDLRDILTEALGFDPTPLDEINNRFGRLAASARELGASQDQLLAIEFARGQALAQLQAELEASVASIIDQIQGLNSSAFDATSSIGSLGDSFRDLSGIADSLRGTIRNIQGSAATSNLDPIGRRDFLQDQFDAAIAAGDFGTANQIAGDLAGAIRDVGASSSDADNRISDLLAALEAAAQEADRLTPPTGQQVSGIASSASRIEQSALQQVQLAQQLITELTLLAGLDQDIIGLLESNNFSLAELVGLIGVDLAGLGAEQVGLLGGLAEDFGLSLAELEEALNISLGDLSDATSLLNDGLEQAINGLPPEIAGPLLAALADVEATGDVGLLESLIADLAPGFRNELAPFFDNIDITTEAQAQLDELTKIKFGIRDLILETGRVADNLQAQNSNLEIPSFALGTGFAPGGLANVHQGEIILPAPVSDFARRSGLTIGSNDNRATESLLERMTAQNDRAAELLQRIESAVTTAGRNQTRELERSNRIRESVR